VSLVVSHARAQQKISGLPLALKFMRRGAFIFGCGLLVTLGTWLFIRERFVIFGILHLIGIAVILSPLFFRFGKVNILFGLVCIFAGYLIAGTNGPEFLLPLGIIPPGFTSVDYTPLFPWLGVVLIGMGIGAYLYAGGTRQFHLTSLPDVLVAPLSFLGRHSLVLYLVHQPVIILLLVLATGATIG
jgi:uncharacterized membrane protein